MVCELATYEHFTTGLFFKMADPNSNSTYAFILLTFYTQQAVCL